MFTHFLKRVGIHSFYKRYVNPDYSKELEEEFQEHCREIGRPLFLTLTHFFLWGILLTWPIEYYYYHSSPDLLPYLHLARGAGVLLCSVFLIVDRITDFIDRYMSEFFLTGFIVVVFCVYLSLSHLGGLNRPWFYSAYSMPFVSIIFLNIGFLKRAVFTAGISATTVIGYFLLYPEYLNTPYIFTPLLWLLVLTACSIVFGHVFHNLYKQSYVRGRKLEESMREKDTLLEEIHHRVKNNLQVIISFLNIQQRKETMENPDEIFDESIQRIKAMALVHENLYQSGDLSKINFGSYVENICDNLLSMYSVDEKPDMVLSVDDLDLIIDEAICCGLIINELINNALKHAFENDSENKIEVSIEKREDEVVSLTVSDNGRGLRNQTDLQNFSSTGLSMVKTLTEYELNGELTFKNGNGLAVEVIFSPS